MWNEIKDIIESTEQQVNNSINCIVQKNEKLLSELIKEKLDKYIIDNKLEKKIKIESIDTCIHTDDGSSMIFYNCRINYNGMILLKTEEELFKILYDLYIENKGE